MAILPGCRCARGSVLRECDYEGNDANDDRRYLLHHGQYPVSRGDGIVFGLCREGAWENMIIDVWMLSAFVEILLDLPEKAFERA